MDLLHGHRIAGSAAAVVLAAGALLGGCQSSYTLGVRNATNHPITVSVVEAGSGGQGRVLATRWLGPGDSTTLGPGLSDSARVELVAETNTYPPAAFQVAPGSSSYDIERRDTNRLVLVQRDQR